jgi:hypothetical protein
MSPIPMIPTEMAVVGCVGAIVEVCEELMLSLVEIAGIEVVEELTGEICFEGLRNVGKTAMCAGT